MNNNEDCSICGDSLNSAFSIQLSCNHIYHYECIMKTLQMSIPKYKKKHKNRCPYCNAKIGLLPVVNGLKKTHKYIHYKEESLPISPQNQVCTHILLSGKRKGQQCGRQCTLGLTVCGYHKKDIKILS